IERQPESERAVPVSALTGEGIDRLIDMVETRISANRLTFTLDLDPADGEGISWLHRHAEVLDKALRDDGRFAVTVRVDPAKAERVRNRFGLTKPTDDDAL
ncbi:MAG: GTPase HflX, partial [Pseudolabrys sp.]